VRVLVVNTGSTTVKAALVEVPPGSWLGEPVDLAWSAHDDLDALDDVLRAAPAADAVGHRVVHGGERYRAPVPIDDAVLAAVEELAPLAPLHNPPALVGIRGARAVLADVPHVAVFDTAFHATLPPAASTYGVPASWRDRGWRRFGFHGINHEYAAHRAAALLGRGAEELAVVTCHLGGGCSVTAVDGGRSVDTTMGFTPLEGPLMATRSGTVDPGLVLHALRSGLSVDEVEESLVHGGGLLGLSGVSEDLRTVLAAADRGDAPARLAVDVYLWTLRRHVGAMAAALSGRVDALVLTAGVGEHQPVVQQAAAGALGIDLPHGSTGGDAVLTRAGAAPAVVAVAAREDWAIARATAEVARR